MHPHSSAHSTAGNRPDVNLINMLLNRLERISADSIWAHRASGIRGSLLRELDQIQAGKDPEATSLKSLIGSAFHILHQAARQKG